jgi:hypothetical protein
MDLDASVARREVCSWDAGRASWQAIVNEQAIPPRDRQRADRPSWPVVVRVVWERDGEQLVVSRAVDWVRSSAPGGWSVLVRVVDRRRSLGWVWLAAADVHRAPPAGVENL